MQVHTSLVNKLVQFSCCLFYLHVCAHCTHVFLKCSVELLLPVFLTVKQFHAASCTLQLLLKLNERLLFPGAEEEILRRRRKPQQPASLSQLRFSTITTIFHPFLFLHLIISCPPLLLSARLLCLADSTLLSRPVNCSLQAESEEFKKCVNQETKLSRVWSLHKDTHTIGVYSSYTFLTHHY